VPLYVNRSSGTRKYTCTYKSWDSRAKKAAERCWDSNEVDIRAEDFGAESFLTYCAVRVKAKVFSTMGLLLQRDEFTRGCFEDAIELAKR